MTRKILGWQRCHIDRLSNYHKRHLDGKEAVDIDRRQGIIFYAHRALYIGYLYSQNYLVFQLHWAMQYVSMLQTIPHPACAQ